VKKTLHQAVVEDPDCEPVGVRVYYESKRIDGQEPDAALHWRDHRAGSKWTLTKRHELIVRDSKGKQIALYHQWAWRQVILGIQEKGDK